MVHIIQTKILYLNTPIRSDLCDFNDAYIVVTGKITATNPNYSRNLGLKNTPAPFFNCILKINNQLVEDAQDLDFVIPIYNLLYYSKILGKLQDLFRIIILTFQTLHMLAKIQGQEYFIQSITQKVLTITQNWLVNCPMVEMN